MFVTLLTHLDRRSSLSQVIVQLRKVCDRLAEGVDAKEAVVVTWEEREKKARAMLG